jgi:hypothetical protein
MQGNAKYLFIWNTYDSISEWETQIEFQIYSEIGCLVVSSNQTISAIKEFRHKKILILILILSSKLNIPI